MQFVLSPWVKTFESFAQSIRKRAIVVAPFIADQPLRRFASLLDTKRLPRISLLTNLSADSLLQGSVDSKAIADFCKKFPTTVVRHLPRWHAKAYVADQHTAIVTSGNLTHGSLCRNYEYGIYINDSAIVLKIANGLCDYGNLETAVSLEDLNHLAELFEAFRNKNAEVLNPTHAGIKQEFENQLEIVHASLIQLRARSGENANSTLGRTILYVLRKGPLTTQEIHPLVQNIHPDLCDDSVDRIIDGVHFGKR